jgi:hypothetical protein
MPFSHGPFEKAYVVLISFTIVSKGHMKYYEDERVMWFNNLARRDCTAA